MTSTRLTPLLVISVLSFGALGCSNKPSTSPSSPAPRKQDGQTPGDSTSGGKGGRHTAGAPSLSLSADELYQRFTKDREGTHAKYEGATVEVTGVVRDVDDGPGGSPRIYLHAGGDIMGLPCLTVEKEPWGKVTAGQKVKLKGKVPSEAVLSPGLVDCEFADPGQKPAITLSAEQLAREYTADPEATEKRYANKGMVVTGEVLKKVDKGGSYTVTLKGTDKVAVSCGIGLDRSRESKERYEKVKVGKAARVNGRLAPGPHRGEISLYSCLLITR